LLVEVVVVSGMVFILGSEGGIGLEASRRPRQTGSRLIEKPATV
jgi:hypothetical protein